MQTSTKSHTLSDSFKGKPEVADFPKDLFTPPASNLGQLSARQRNADSGPILRANWVGGINMSENKYGN